MIILMLGLAVSLAAQDEPVEVNTSDEAIAERSGDQNTIEYLGSFLWDSIVPSSENDITTEFELAATFTGYSDVRIPGDDGTLFSLSEDLKADVTPAFRFRQSKRFGDRHNISLLLAPLHVVSKGTIDREIDFAGETYLPGEKLKGTYWFNSYRLTYRYDFLRNMKTDLGIGFTAKIREAGIKLEGNGKMSKKINVGFVPIINFRYNQYLGEKWSLLVEGDALAAPQGRAEDIYAGIRYKVTDGIKLKLGYRLLEGGADNDEVYNFALFHYAALGVEFGY
jgi:hypothetical protein